MKKILVSVTFFEQDLHFLLDILVFLKQQYHFPIIQLSVTIYVSQYSLHISNLVDTIPDRGTLPVRLLNVTFWLM